MTASGLEGKNVGKYLTLRRLEGFGHGESYISRHQGLARDCILEFVPDEIARDAYTLEACRQAIAHIAKLQHLAFANVLDAFDWEGRYCVVYSLIEAKSFLVDRKSPLSPSDVANLFVPALEGLKALHDAGSGYYAIRPSSLILLNPSEGRWIDPGFRYDLTAANRSLPHLIEAAKFVSPEEALGKPATPASDLYSLGVLLYYAFTGIFPFEGSDVRSLLYLQANDTPLPPMNINKNLEPALSDLVVTLMSRDPSRRGTMARVIPTLGPYVKVPTAKPVEEKRPVRKLEERRAPMTAKPIRRGGLLLGGVVVAALIAAAALAVLWLPKRQPSQAPSTPAKTTTDVGQELLETQYKNFMEQGDASFKKGDPGVARGLYEQAREIKETLEINRRIEQCLATLEHEKMLQQAKEKYQRIVDLASHATDPTALSFECDEFMRKFPDVPQADEVKRIQAMVLQWSRDRFKKVSTKPPALEQPKREPEPTREPDPPPAQPKRSDLDDAGALIAKKDYAGAHALLVKLLGGESKAQAASELSKILFEEKRWEDAFNGRDMNAFTVVTLSDSAAEVSKEAPEIAAWARDDDVVLWQFKDFDPTRLTGLSMEVLIEEKLAEEHGIGVIFDWESGNVFKQFVFNTAEVQVKSRMKKEWKTLGEMGVPKKECRGVWHRLTIVVEGDTLVALCDDDLIFSGPTSQAKFTKDTRLILQGCKGRLRKIQVRHK